MFATRMKVAARKVLKVEKAQWFDRLKEYN